LKNVYNFHNLKEVLKIYQHVAYLQELAREISSSTVVLHSHSPWAWRPHLARGGHPGNYDVSTGLTLEHRPELEAISQHMLECARNPYSYRDRDIDSNPFNCYSSALENHNFPNLIQSTRGSNQWRQAPVAQASPDRE